MAAKTKKGAVEKELPWFAPAQIKKFFGEVQIEFHKVVWPDKKTTLGLTGMVVVLSLVLSIYLGAVDMLIGKIVSSFLR